MKKTILPTICLVVMLTIQSFGQNTEDSDPQINKSFTYGIKVNANLLTAEKTMEEQDEKSSTLNFSFGLVLAKKLNSSLTLMSGVNFSQVNYLFGERDFSPVWPSDIDDNFGVNQERSWLRSFNKSIFVGIPVELHLFPLKEKNLFIKLGYEQMFHVNTELEGVHFVGGVEGSHVEGSGVLVNNGLNKLRVGFGYEIDTKQFYSLVIEPEFEYYLSKSHKNVPLYDRAITSLGLSLRVMFY